MFLNEHCCALALYLWDTFHFKYRLQSCITMKRIQSTALAGSVLYCLILPIFVGALFWARARVQERMRRTIAAAYLYFKLGDTFQLLHSQPNFPSLFSNTASIPGFASCLPCSNFLAVLDQITILKLSNSIRLRILFLSRNMNWRVFSVHFFLVFF